MNMVHRLSRFGCVNIGALITDQVSDQLFFEVARNLFILSPDLALS